MLAILSLPSPEILGREWPPTMPPTPASWPGVSLPRMETPVRGVRFIHRAILAEAGQIEASASAGRSADVAQRLPFFERVLHLHNTGEEVGLFPDIDAKAPDVVPAYFLDHREEKVLFANLRDACASGGPNLVRAAAAFAAHLRLHIKKEEELL